MPCWSNVAILNNLAWLLATCSDATVRNGEAAVRLASRANQLSAGGNPAVIETLAAANAEAGQFPEALAAAEQARQNSRSRKTTPPWPTVWNSRLPNIGRDRRFAMTVPRMSLPRETIRLADGMSGAGLRPLPRHSE